MERGKLMVDLATRALKNKEDISMNEDVQNLTNTSFNTVETNQDDSNYLNEPFCGTNHELLDKNQMLSDDSTADIQINEDVQNLTEKSYTTIETNRDGLNYLNEPSCSTNHELSDKNILLSDGSSDLYEPSDSESLCSSEEENREKKKKLTRWKKATPENWEKNKMKRKRKSSRPYKTKQGFKAGKSPKDVNCDKCRWHCTSKIDNDYRKEVCSSFWKLDYCRQKDFIINYVTNEPTKTKRIRTGSGINKQNSRMYFFKKGDERIRVCKNFFLRTLSISHGPVEKALAGKNDSGIFIETDQRGRKELPNKTAPSVIQKVKLHIESFPTVESHYCRKTTKRQYLDPNLSIRKMYELYVAGVEENEKNKNEKEPIVSEITYRRYFSENYNLSFFHPKKDQCIICNNYKNEKQDEKMRIEYEAHIKRKNEANKAKIEDKLRAVEDKSFMSVSFDLQSVLQVPSSAASQMYYSRKINVYNLTVYESAPPNKGYCFFWSEVNGQRGSCEIGTALYQWILQVPNHVNEISLFSDTCSGQNRNQYIAALFMYVVQSTPLRIIEHKFLEKGHSHMECDSMHSAIESAKRHVSVYSLNDWLNIFLTARSCRGKKKASGSYIVTQINFSDVIDLKTLAAKIIKNRSTDSTGEKVNWLRIKVLRYEKEKPGVILFKYSHEDPEFRVIQTYGRGRPSVITGDLPKLYNSLLPISEAKKKDLMRLCSTNVIPQEYHSWFKSLPVDKKKTDRAPEPSVDSDDSDE